MPKAKQRRWKIKQGRPEFKGKVTVENNFPRKKSPNTYIGFLRLFCS